MEKITPRRADLSASNLLIQLFFSSIRDVVGWKSGRVWPALGMQQLRESIW